VLRRHITQPNPSVFNCQTTSFTQVSKVSFWLELGLARRFERQIIDDLGNWLV
jgi:hypothetical protein